VIPGRRPTAVDAVVRGRSSGDELAPDSYLAEVLETLWPAPARVSRIPRFRGADRAATEFVVVPSLRSPKLVLPRRPRRVTAAALGNYKASASGAARLRLRAMAMAARLGATVLLPDRVRVTPAPTDAGTSLSDHLRARLSRDFHLALYIGPQRAVQKPVLQLLDRNGTTFAFAKIGTNELTRALVRSEAESLRFLTSTPLAHLRVPRPLYHGRWNGHEVLVQEALHPGRGADVGPPGLAPAMVELARSKGTETSQLRASRYLTELRHRIRAEQATGLTDTLLSRLDRLVEYRGDHRLEFGSWHGDFAPWNMTTAPGRVLVWDWEQYETGVPVGFDAVHYHVQTAVVMDRRTVAAAFESARAEATGLLAPFGVDESSGELTVALYAVEIATRYIHDGELDAGTVMGRVGEWLAPVLDGLLDRLRVPERA
jgi:Phosphotransferase enzyme family